eukprot:10052895-Alexandrium_andersonii.AAC.1
MDSVGPVAFGVPTEEVALTRQFMLDPRPCSLGATLLYLQCIARANVSAVARASASNTWTTPTARLSHMLRNSGRACTCA